MAYYETLKKKEVYVYPKICNYLQYVLRNYV